MQNPISLKYIQELREKIARLDAHTLHRACIDWQQRERSCLLVVVMHIAEIEKRGVHLDQGFMHLGDYCHQHLGLSEGEAWSRVHVAKASNAHPQLLLSLASGYISLGVAAMLARHLTTENRDDLLHRCAGKSKRWVEEFLASLGKIQTQTRSSLRPVFVTVPPQDKSKPIPTAPIGFAPPTVSGAELPLVANPLPPAAGPVEHQLVHQLRCTINNETKAKLLRLAEVLGIVDPLHKLDQLIAKATEIALHAKDPALRTHGSKSPTSTPVSAKPAQRPPSPAPAAT